MKLPLFKKVIFLLFLTGSLSIVAQTTDTLPKTGNFFGAITLTTKGLSTFPNLTLGKPAAVFDFSVGGKKTQVRTNHAF